MRRFIHRLCTNEPNMPKPVMLCCWYPCAAAALTIVQCLIWAIPIVPLRGIYRTTTPYFVDRCVAPTVQLYLSTAPPHRTMAVLRLTNQRATMQYLHVYHCLTPWFSYFPVWAQLDQKLEIINFCQLAHREGERTGASTARVRVK